MKEDKIISPCISICKTDPVTGFCYGCARTNNEKKIWKDEKTKDTWKNENLKDKKIMTTKTFNNLIEHDFDFLNIDLEGHDYEILQTIDLRKFNPKLICIEILENCLDKENIHKFMKQNNYIFIKNLGPSFFFARG